MSKKKDSLYFTDLESPESYSLQNQIAENLEFRMAKNKKTVTKEDMYKAVALSTRDKMMRRWMRTQAEYHTDGTKKVFYLSMEFLMGRLLESALINLGIYDEAEKIVKEYGYELRELIEYENDMGLGNGGLGRLAACFLDSMATLQLPAYGYGIRYEYGIFSQDIEKGYQVEHPDNWLGFGSPWEVMRPDLTFKIKFYGRVDTYYDKAGNMQVSWVDTKDVLALGYDIPIPGYNNNNVNNLRLWEAKATHDFDFEFFNQGDYVKAVENKNDSENISKVLYPNDNTVFGKELRLKQQYFFVSASLQDIIRKYNDLYGSDFSKFHEINVIQLNDTHPAIAIPELMRILIDEQNLGWDEAWKITTKTFAYTNHTVLSEALEKWSVKLFEYLLPRHLQIIYEINFRFLDQVRKKFMGDADILRRMSIIMEGDEKMIRMAHLAIVGSYSVNGVARLHTEILKEKVFPDFYKFSPEKFNSKTNGITQRRWLKKANPELSEIITEKIGDGWVKELYKLKDLEKYAEDRNLQEKWIKAKDKRKAILIDHIKEEYGIEINPDSMFDVQIKRIHEYKRQLLNILHVITHYNQIKSNPDAEYVPRTIMFGGKAAPGYRTAKMLIKLISSVADTVNFDPDVGDRLKVLFLKNYSVTLAEKIIPASELSEQISTAGYEASGTGNMKFQLNGALTIGTLDGANIEMKEEMGDDNIFIFGMNADEVDEIRASGYNPRYYYETDNDLKLALDMIQNNFFSHMEPGIFDIITNEVLHGPDRFCVLADFRAYINKQREVDEMYKDKFEWNKRSILNVARVGKFSSDRTISDYNNDVWHLDSKDIIL